MTVFPSGLYVICDADACARAGWTLEDFASTCLDGGATLLQIRAKQESSSALLAQAEAIVRRAAGYGARIIVNDRADIARLAGAAGVHVGQDDLPPGAIRRIVGSDAVVGWSTHTPEQLVASRAEPISYLAIGPVFQTSTKDTGYDSVGLDRVRAAAEEAHRRPIPLVAIGGITLDRAQAVIDAGADSVAVITDLLVTNDPRTRVEAYLALLSRV